ncbi:MAG: hypothetical protein AAGA85_08235 [Bacteroidota bacterium]
MELFFQYLTIYALSTLKFIFGPALGLTYGLSIPETIFFNTLGMVTPAYLLRIFGDRMRQLYRRWFIRKDQRIFTKRNRTFVRVWRRWGLPGVAFLVPLILMPIPGAIIANTFSTDTRPYIRWLWLFGALYSLGASLILRFGLDLFRGVFIQ